MAALVPFDGHDVELMTPGADAIRYLIKSVPCAAALMGAPVQPFCAEMLHWDDCRAAANLNDGTPSLVATFCPGGSWAPPFRGHTVTTAGQSGTSTNTVRCVTAAAALQGAACQDLSPEMVRYDDYAASGLAPTLPATMHSRFAKDPPFAGHTVEAVTQAGERTRMVVLCITATAALAGVASQPFTPEMLRWDELRAAAAAVPGVPPADGPQQTMRAVWGA